jgi:hypothetical protein
VSDDAAGAILRFARVPSSAAKILSFNLINAATNLPVPGYETLRNHVILRRNTLPPQLTLRANTEPARVGSVRFSYDLTRTRQIENGFPYALAGDRSGDFHSWGFLPGTHTVIATPFSRSQLTGNIGRPLALTFHVY